MSFISTMFIFYLFLTIGKWYVPSEIGLFCILIGYAIQFFGMSAFFWLNALSHDVWNSFRRIKPVNANKQSRSKLGIFSKKYKWYALYAWGCPLIVTFVTVMLQYLENIMTMQVFTPGIGKEFCSLEPKWGKFFYFHLIIGPILVSN